MGKGRSGKKKRRKAAPVSEFPKEIPSGSAPAQISSVAAADKAPERAKIDALIKMEREEPELDVDITVAPVEDIEAIEIDLFADEHPRKAERVRVDARVEVLGFFGEGTRDNRVRDMSLHGVFVETAQLLEVGDPVMLQFPLEAGRKVKVAGRVRWVTPFGGLRDARPGMGIELVGLSLEAREELSEMLRRRRA